MHTDKRKVRPLILLSLVILLLLAGYLFFNYKQVKQSFLNGLNDGKAQRAHEDSAEHK